MSAGAKSFRFDWERQVISDRGPANPTTRLVLLTLATHINKEGTAWPTTMTLAAETALSERSVCTHLEIAVIEGWLERKVSKAKGKAWKRYIYSIVIPPFRTEPRSAPSGEGTEPRSIANGVLGAEAGANATEPAALGGEAGDGLVLNDVQSNNVLNTLLNISKNKAADFKEKKGEQSKDVKQWAKELGIIEYPGEHPGDFQVRVASAVEKHKAQTAGMA